MVARWLLRICALDFVQRVGVLFCVGSCIWVCLGELFTLRLVVCDCVGVCLVCIILLLLVESFVGILGLVLLNRLLADSYYGDGGFLIWLWYCDWLGDLFRLLLDGYLCYGLVALLVDFGCVDLALLDFAVGFAAVVICVFCVDFIWYDGIVVV